MRASASQGPRLVLHVGAMKTGTTFVQNLLEANTERLAELGWYVPPQRRVVRATRELLALTDAALGAGRRGVADDAPRWTALMDEVREHTAAPGCRGAVISMEFLSFARRGGVERVLATLHGLEPSVVLTVRDAVRALPSQWQSLSRNGQSLSWPQFAVAARSTRQRPALPGVRSFRRTQDIPRMVRAWAHAVPADRFYAVTVPGGPDQPRTLLWERFCRVLDVDVARTVTDAAFDNPQLGYGSCEILRRVNGAGLGDEAPGDYRPVVRRLTHEHLLGLREEQTRPRMDRTTAEFAVALNRRTLTAIGRNATLVGTTDDLPTVVAREVELDPGREPTQVPDAEVRRATEVLFVGAVSLCEEQGIRLPADLGAPLPADLADAVDRVAAVMGVAITGDVSHRPRPRVDVGPASTVSP